MDNKFVLSPSFNDIVFENRHKAYGAYDIRRKYARYAVLAGACAIFFFTCGSLTWAYVNQPEETHNWRIIEINDPPVIPPVIDDKSIKDPEPPKQPEPLQTSGAELGPKTPDITSNIDITEDPNETPPANLEAGKDPLGIIGGVGTGPKTDTVGPITVVEPPIGPPVDWTPFPPKCEGLDAYLQKNIRYPQICRETGIEGTVYVEFIVDTKGDYRDVKVLKGPHPALNSEALRVMSMMPKWTPAKDDNGRLVEFIMRKPIKFQLQ